ncbi:MAG: hypothetical protein N4J56_002839 [Chroococcidiopsis sp. SAG 2025]|nr:hypothetical protein [Chroococcidiopsis sp. SAG 2025]
MKTRPATLSQWVFFDEGQKFSCMLGSTLDHAK